MYQSTDSGRVHARRLSVSGPLQKPTVCDLVPHFKPPRPHTATRFQRKQYAPIDIVLTEKKGFGLRAAGNLPKCVHLPLFTMFLAHVCFLAARAGMLLFMNMSGMSSVHLP